MQLSAARAALPGSIVSSMTLAATLNMKADASFAWTFDIRISGTQYMTFRSVEKDLGRNRPQIRRGLGLFRASAHFPKFVFHCRATARQLREVRAPAKI